MPAGSIGKGARIRARRWPWPSRVRVSCGLRGPSLAGPISDSSQRAATKSDAAVRDDLDEALHKRESRVGDLAPATVDDQRVPAILHLDDLAHALVSLLPLVGR